MKKFVLFLLTLVILAVAAIYIFIPARLSITSSTTVRTTDIGTERFLMDESKWPLWWNYNDSSLPNTNLHPVRFFAGKDEYKMADKFYKSATIRISHDLQQIGSKLAIIPLLLDSTGIEWNCSLDLGSNPYKRLTGYLDAKQIKKNMDTVLTSLRLFLSKNENVYGIPIEKNHLKDTLYVTTKTTLQAYPTIPVIYDLIKKIQGYASQNGANQTGSPIFNVTDMGNGHFQLMAGIAVDKNIPEKNDFSVKHMVRGNFMITEVVGGDQVVNKASQNLHQYFADYRKTSMAMSFTMLVTDRMYQPDSSKWITKIYLPVY
jgi:predicted transcriptional regulator YdeE